MKMGNGNIEKIPSENIRITVVYDNNPYKEGLETAWGFSCYVEGAEENILFDTGGNGEILLNNMDALGIDSGEIDALVLSHIHGDHTGGIDSILNENHGVVVYIPDSFSKRVEERIKKYGTEVVRIDSPEIICRGVYSSGELGAFIKEQSLIINTDKGSVVITGCAHPGIVNIVKKVKQITGNRILLAMGGFHLGSSSNRELMDIISSFQELSVKYSGPCHCSGDVARELFLESYGKNYIEIGVGKKIYIKQL